MANTRFGQYVDRMAATLNKQWQENKHEVDVSKDDRHVIRLAAVLHVFNHVTEQKLNNDPATPPPTIITCPTLERAIALTDYFAEQRTILDKVGYDDS